MDALRAMKPDLIFQAFGDIAERLAPDAAAIRPHSR
jgi:hypothetical protein